MALNELSDQLTKEVSSIESVINRLNLGITASVFAEQWFSEDGLISDDWSLTYGRLASGWGFSIEHVHTDENFPSDDCQTYSTWAFKDAPREKRLAAVEKIPALLDALVKKSSEVANQITEKVGYVKGLAATLSPVKPQGKGK